MPDFVHLPNDRQLCVSLLDLQLAVVAGSVALGYGEPFFDAAQQEIDARSCLDFSKATLVVPGGLGPDGPLIGAARVAFSSAAGRLSGSENDP